MAALEPRRGRLNVEAPFGLSFDVEELVEIRGWAERRHMAMAIVLDSVIDGVEFEEMVVITTADRQRRLLMLWRRPTEIVAQRIGQMPRAFAGVLAALEAMLAPPPRRSWLRA